MWEAHTWKHPGAPAEVHSLLLFGKYLAGRPHELLTSRYLVLSSHAGCWKKLLTMDNSNPSGSLFSLKATTLLLSVGSQAGERDALPYDSTRVSSSAPLLSNWRPNVFHQVPFNYSGSPQLVAEHLYFFQPQTYFHSLFLIVPFERPLPDLRGEASHRDIHMSIHRYQAV